MVSAQDSAVQSVPLPVIMGKVNGMDVVVQGDSAAFFAGVLPGWCSDELCSEDLNCTMHKNNTEVVQVSLKGVTLLQRNPDHLVLNKSEDDDSNLLVSPSPTFNTLESGSATFVKRFIFTENIEATPTLATLYTGIPEVDQTLGLAWINHETIRLLAAAVETVNLLSTSTSTDNEFTLINPSPTETVKTITTITGELDVLRSQLMSSATTPVPTPVQTDMDDPELESDEIWLETEFGVLRIRPSPSGQYGSNHETASYFTYTVKQVPTATDNEGKNTGSGSVEPKASDTEIAVTDSATAMYLLSSVQQMPAGAIASNYQHLSTSVPPMPDPEFFPEKVNDLKKRINSGKRAKKRSHPDNTHSNNASKKTRKNAPAPSGQNRRQFSLSRPARHSQKHGIFDKNRDEARRNKHQYTHTLKQQITRELEALEGSFEKGLSANEKNLGDWLAQLYSYEPEASKALRAHWNAIRVERVIQKTESGDNHPDEPMMKTWLIQLERSMPDNARRLNLRWDVVRAIRVIKAATAGIVHRDESRMNLWLATIRKHSPQQANLLSTQWDCIRVERVIKKTESGDNHPDEPKMRTWLKLLKRNMPDNASRLSLRWDVVRATRVIRAATEGIDHRNEARMIPWLATIRKHSPQQADLLSMQWDCSQVERVIQKTESGDNHPDEPMMRTWLMQLERSMPDNARRLNLRWDVVRVIRVIRAATAGMVHRDESRMNHWLAIIREHSPQQVDLLSTQWNCILVKRVLEAAETGKVDHDESKVYGWLVQIEKHDPEHFKVLRDRWVSIHIDRIERVLQCLEAGESHPDEPMMETWLIKLERNMPDNARRLKLRWNVVRVIRVIRAATAGIVHRDESRMNHWLAIIRIHSPQQVDLLSTQWNCILVKRVLEAAETGKVDHDESKVYGWLVQIEKHDPERFKVLRDRWVSIHMDRIERVLQCVEAGESHPDESDIDNWLYRLKIHDFKQANLLGRKWSMIHKARAEKGLQAMEEGKLNPDEPRMKDWLTRLLRYYPELARPLFARWDFIRILRVISATEAGQKDPNEPQMNGCFKELREYAPEQAIALNCRWDAIRIERVIRAIENGKMHHDEHQVNDWLATVKEHDPLWYNLLKKRRGKALIALAEQVLLLVEAGETHSCESHLDHWLNTVLRWRSGSLKERLNIARIKRVLWLAKAGIVPPAEPWMNQWFEEASKARPEQVEQLRKLWDAIHAKSSEQAQYTKLLDPRQVRLLNAQQKPAQAEQGEPVAETACPDGAGIIVGLSERQKHDCGLPGSIDIGCSKASVCLSAIVTQFEQVLLAVEAGEIHANASCMNGWLSVLQPYDPELVNALKVRLHFAIIRQVYFIAVAEKNSQAAVFTLIVPDV